MVQLKTTHITTVEKLRRSMRKDDAIIALQKRYFGLSHNKDHTTSLFMLTSTRDGIKSNQSANQRSALSTNLIETIIFYRFKLTLENVNNRGTFNWHR